jgi:hypothetical protein
MLDGIYVVVIDGFYFTAKRIVIAPDVLTF